MITKLTPIPGIAHEVASRNATKLVECHCVSLQWTAIPRCDLCGFIAEPQFGCIPRMEAHLRDVHGIVPPAGACFWIDCGTMGEQLP